MEWGGREADGGGQWPWTQQGFKKVTKGEIDQVLLLQGALPFSYLSHSQGSTSWLGWVGVENDGKNLRPAARGPGLPPAKLGWLWEAEPGSVYPGHALPEQMGACQCCQPGTGLTSSHCQVAGDLRLRGGACLVWLFMRGSLSSWEPSAHLSEHSLQGA